MSLVSTTVITGILSVFVILTSLYLIFSLMERVMKIKFKKNIETINKDESNLNVYSKVSSGEEATAIIVGVKLYLLSHDKEDRVLTIKQSPKSYSPWSSKSLSVYNNIFKKK